MLRPSAPDGSPIKVTIKSVGDGITMLKSAGPLNAAVQKEVTFNVKIKYPGKRDWEWYTFPPITNGDGTLCARSLELLWQQGVFQLPQYEEIAQIIALAESATQRN